MFFELGPNGSGLATMIFYMMSPRTHHNYLLQNHWVNIPGVDFFQGLWNICLIIFDSVSFITNHQISTGPTKSFLYSWKNIRMSTHDKSLPSVRKKVVLMMLLYS